MHGSGSGQGIGGGSRRKGSRADGMCRMNIEGRARRVGRIKDGSVLCWARNTTYVTEKYNKCRIALEQWMKNQVNERDGLVKMS